MNKAQLRLVKSLNKARRLNASGKAGAAIARFIKLRNRVIYACDIGITAEIPVDCVFHHSGLGVVIGDHVVMGNGCQIFSNVCIGVKRNGDGDKDPVIGNNVVIGSGAIILGNIKVGNNVIIAAGSVVLDSVPDNTMVAGNPAVVKKQLKQV